LKKAGGISLYWKLQIIGWLVTSLYWGFTSFIDGNFIWKLGIADFALDLFVGILLTHFYRSFALKNGWQKLDLKRLVPRLAAAVLILSLLYMFLIVGKLYLIRWLILEDFPVSFADFFNSSRLPVFVTGTRLMSIWVLAYHLYQYSRREIESVKENARLSLIAKETQLNNLTAQLNPHFFFNSLNNIKFLVAENPDAARRAIDLLSELLRNALTSKDDRRIALQNEIGLVRDYLELEKMRYEERLQIMIEADPGLAESLIPPLCIQVLVENAIKHGIEKRKNGGFIKVKIEREDEFIKIGVENSGRLIEGNHASGIGIKNLKERLALQYNEKAVFEIKQAKDETVLATLLIPSA
jgi:sensor histidine kinase YesM